jgi:mono/diheme cytochrome c family protein
MSDDKKSSPRLEQASASDESIQAVHAQLLREKAEPVEGYAPLPLMLLGILSALVFFAAIYLERFSAHFDPMVYNETARGAATAGPVQVDPVARGKSLFMANCIACHQVSGQGIPGMYPPLAGSEWVTGGEEGVVRVLLHGLSGPITVEGQQFNNVMPSFGTNGFNWKDNQIAWVLTYVRQEWGNAAPEVTVETVARIRAETGARSTAWTEAEIKPFLEKAAPEAAPAAQP